MPVCCAVLLAGISGHVLPTPTHPLPSRPGTPPPAPPPPLPQDTIPDEAFGRLRGTLFFGPAFRVTRNKLLFRDNLGEVLAAAVPGERQMEAKFRGWLQRCHATLDKSVRFEALSDSRTQVGGQAGGRALDEGWCAGGWAV